MTKEDFFGAIKANLERLVESHVRLPDYNMDSLKWCGKFHQLSWLCQIKRLTDHSSTTPPNICCYDLESSNFPFLGKLRFRIVACFVDEPTRAGYIDAKFQIRKWYQRSGFKDGEKPYSGALIVGSSSLWPEDMLPDANDMPFEHVAFRMLAAPFTRPQDGMRILRDGVTDTETCKPVFWALVPEPFATVASCVRNCVQNLLLPNGGGCILGRYLTVRKVMEQLRPRNIPKEAVSQIFNMMQAEGTHRIGDTNDKDRPDEDRMYIDNKAPSWWARFKSKLEGDDWYAKSTFCRWFSLGTFSYLLALPLSLFEKVSPSFLFENRSLFIVIGGALLGLTLLLWLLGRLGRRYA